MSGYIYGKSQEKSPTKTSNTYLCRADRGGGNTRVSVSLGVSKEIEARGNFHRLESEKNT